MAVPEGVMNVQHNAERFGKWLRANCVRAGIEDGAALYWVIVRRTNARIDKRTAERWFEGLNAPRGQQMAYLLDALKQVLPAKEVERSFRSFQKAEIELLTKVLLSSARLPTFSRSEPPSEKPLKKAA